MSFDVMLLTMEDTYPAVACDRGVSLVPAAERQTHAPDAMLLVIDRGSLIARCSCWWKGLAPQDLGDAGIIGHYAATDAESSDTLLSTACDLLTCNGASVAVGPMDGTTWRRYRFVVDRGTEPPFFLEPDNSDEWPGYWSRAGFTELASYMSAVDEDLSREDPRAAATLERLRDAGITIRQFDPADTAVELQRIFRLSLTAFSRNFLYTPIDEMEFVAQYHAVLPHVRPELVLLAEKDDALVGFMFAVPDLLQAKRGGAIDTVILKTIAVDPAMSGIGLGNTLMRLVERKAREIGFKRAIHALIHETNRSRKMSERSGRVFRRYALFSKALTA